MAFVASVVASVVASAVASVVASVVAFVASVACAVAFVVACWTLVVAWMEAGLEMNYVNYHLTMKRNHLSLE